MRLRLDDDVLAEPLFGDLGRGAVLDHLVEDLLHGLTQLVVALLKADAVLLLRKGVVTRDFTTTPFIVAAFIYLLITFVVTVLFKFAERKTNYE